jgi:hypothetical protein
MAIVAIARLWHGLRKFRWPGARSTTAAGTAWPGFTGTAGEVPDREPDPGCPARVGDTGDAARSAVT